MKSQQKIMPNKRIHSDSQERRSFVAPILAAGDARRWAASVMKEGYIMTWWVYKCNSKGRSYQKTWGDWNDFFQGNDKRWGNTQWVPALEDLNKGDKIIAYQTDRNELVGIAEVTQSCAIDGYLYLDPIETIGVKVRPLKADPDIDAIPAFKPSPIKTVYEISSKHAKKLLKAAKRAKSSGSNNAAKQSSSGGGFGDAEKNTKVEKAAIEFITQQYINEGWTVQSKEIISTV